MEPSAGETRKQLNLFQIGLIAARPRTLPAAASPVIVGMAVAFTLGQFRLGPALAALLGALFIQIGANYANDAYDFQKGADTQARLGPLRVTQAGLLTPTQTFGGMWLFFGLAALAGIYLIIQAGWPVVFIGLFSILAAIAYTGGPFPLGYNGLGELFVFIFFGLVAVCGTVFVQARSLPALALWSAVPMGLLAAAILSVNNLRDLETDRLAGKHTLAARFGLQAARAVYLAELLLAYLIPLLMAIFGVTSPWLLLAWISTWKAVPLLRLVFTERGRPLNRALGETGQLELLYGLLFSLGLLVEHVLR